MLHVSHPEYLFNFQDAFYKDGPQLVSDPRQQEAKERDAKYGIKDAKDFPAFRARSYVSVTCWTIESRTRRRRGEEMKKRDRKVKKQSRAEKSEW